MGKVLTEAQVDAYRRDGIRFPIDVMSPQEAAGLLARFEATEAAHGGRLPPRINQKPHLLYPWIAELVRHPRILDAVEDVLGPDLLCWSAQFFAKNAHDPSFVSWHQDGTYWGLSSPDVITAWVALTPSVPENGCMQVVPGTQLKQVEHVDTFADTNLLSRGQEIRVEVNPADVVPVILRPGQMSLHHVLIFHGSEPNTADYRRIGFAIRYIPTHVHQTHGPRESATLVRGTDRYGHFDAEPAPQAELHPDAVARHAAIVDRQLKILYAGAAKPGKLGATTSR
ncbi:MAG: phytanoyl-CoA dioxygenase family protein [Burkholderiaceae bacterium]